ncbi:PilW family protein [Thiohalomonas denitrificans]|uniref:Type IV pilus assembly protein PilW n=1 Tax=Thiohalomonas denitrificans TaxID=415747 RepID=A0A1G5PQC3_9GAMM|nr:PilW family protein [Thiohalomonas denitrificans]SCZ51617.1 type IV pilus assembly protein PilW [Thiohalomonas denitrificans]
MAIPGKLPRQQGLSLVELMVAVVIGLMLLAGLLSVVTNSSKSYGELNKTSRQLENGRYALGLLADEIQHAGFYGGHFNLGSAPGTLPDVCSTTQAVLASALPLPIQGLDDPTSPGLSCLDDANHLDGTDILVVRRASTTAGTLGALELNRFYVQGTGEGVVLEQENDVHTVSDDVATFKLERRDDVDGSLEPAPVYPFTTHIYFVSPCSEPSGSVCDGSADGGSPIPTLNRLKLTVDGSGPTWEREPLVEGIEMLQIDYGVDDDGDGSPTGSYVTNPTTADGWSNVVTARVNILARHIEPSGGHQDVKIYTLGEHGTVGPFNDRYKRHVYSTTVRASNPSMRRQQ